jgi:PRTRC genetic system protein A
MTKNPLDQALQGAVPTVMVPRFGTFEPLQSSGHRFLVASDGLWLEVRRSWLYLRKPIARQNKVAMPYGTVTETLEFLCGPVPLELLREFSAQARNAAPLETAAWGTRDEESGKFMFRRLDANNASAAHINVNRPRLDDNEHLVLDMHSHGRGRAFFSGTDNEDDQGEVKIAMVLGHCNQEKLDTKIRLCCLGLYVPLGANVADDGTVTFEEVRPLQKKEELWNIPSHLGY